MRIIKWLGYVIDSTNDWLGKAVSFLVIVIMVIATMEVTLRYGLNRPTIWAWDVNIQLFAALIFLGAGYHLLHRTIITVDVLYNRFSPKWQAFADVITYLCCLIFCTVIIWGGTTMAVKSWSAMETSRTFFAPPLYYIKTLIPIAGILMVAQWTRQFISSFTDALRAGRRESSEH